MIRRLSPLAAAIAVASLVVPALASAAPEITVGGKKALVATPLAGTSTNTVLKTSIGNLTCGTVEFSTELTANTGSTFAIVGTGTGKTSTCFFKGTTPLTYDDTTVLSIHSGSEGKGTIGLTFEITFPTTTCHYSSTAVPFTYSATADTVQLKGSLTAKPAGCGIATIEGTYMLTSPGGAVVLH